MSNQEALSVLKSVSAAAGASSLAPDTAGGHEHGMAAGIDKGGEVSPIRLSYHSGLPVCLLAVWDSRTSGIFTAEGGLIRLIVHGGVDAPLWRI